MKAVLISMLLVCSFFFSYSQKARVITPKKIVVDTLRYKGYICTYKLNEDFTKGYDVSINTTPPLDFTVKMINTIRDAFHTAIDNLIKK